MPKKKKTRHQKIKADMRHKDYKAPSEMLVPSFQLNPVQPQIKTEKTQTIATAQYAYLYSDLRKTLILTILIIVAELILGNYLK